MSDDVVIYEERDRIGIVRLNRPSKHNAFSAALFDALRKVFDGLPEKVRAVVLTTTSEQFCAGLDLSEHQLSKPFESILFSRSGHKLFEQIQHCGRPIITAMPGAVIGGGLELAAMTHVRIAEPSTFYLLPEGRRAIFLGGGGTVHLAKFIGPD
ncbi:MAG: enoyl-CoA hydratase-related protein, partial [Pseudorhodoplanes sp.]